MDTLGNALGGQWPRLQGESGSAAPGPENERKRHRVLLLAYACIPGRGSEPDVGWNRAIELAKHFNTWVFCSEPVCAHAITAHIDRHGCIPGLHFVFVPEPRWEQFLKRVPGMMYLAYNLWNRRAGRLARRLHEESRFSLVHHLTLCGFREPGYLWKLNAPFVWGPVGGAQNYPWRFLAKAGPWTALCEGARSLLNVLQLRYSPRVRRAARHASLLMAATTVNERAFRRVHAVTPVLLSDTGVHQYAPVDRLPSNESVLRLLSCGVLEPRKALHLLLEALGQLPHGIAWELHVVGSGPLREKWGRLAESYGIADRIRWLGAISHQEALAQFAWADVFVFTSLRDTTGTALCEALATATPIVRLDHQGAADIVDASCGIKIPVTRPSEVVNELARSITLLSQSPELREILGRGAWQRTQEYLWSEQGERLAEMYRRVIAANGTAREPCGALSALPGDAAAAASGASVPQVTQCDLECPPSIAEQVRPTTPQSRSAERSVGLLSLRRSLSLLRSRGAQAAFVGLIDQAIVSGVRFLTTVIIGRLCGAGELGSYTLAFSLLVATLAAQDALIVGPYVVFANRMKGSRKSAYMGSVFLEAAGLALLAVGALLCTAIVLAHVSPGAALGSTIGVLAAIIPFLLLQQLGRLIAFSDFQLRTALLLDVTTAVIQVGGLAVLAAGGALSATAVYGFVGLASMLPGVVWLTRRRQSVVICWDNVSRDVRRNWHLGRWMLASQLTSVLGSYVAGWLLALLLDVKATGIYAACASIACLANPILLGLNNVLLPRTAMAYAEGGHAEVRRVSRKALGVFVGLTGTVALALIVFGQPILATLYGPAFAAHHHVVGILAIATLMNASGMAAGQGLLALERSDIGFVAHLAGVAATCIASFALIPHFGITGAAVGLLLGSAVTAACILGVHETLTHPARAVKRVE